MIARKNLSWQRRGMLKGIDPQQIKLISQIYFDKFELSFLVTGWGFRVKFNIAGTDLP